MKVLSYSYFKKQERKKKILENLKATAFILFMLALWIAAGIGDDPRLIP
jgi:hypothetical protein